MNYYELTITPDTDFPVDGDDVVRIGRVAGRKVAGWWTRAEFDRWLKSRDGSIAEINGDTMTVIARLTKKETRS